MSAMNPFSLFENASLFQNYVHNGVYKTAISEYHSVHSGEKKLRIVCSSVEMHMIWTMEPIGRMRRSQDMLCISEVLCGRTNKKLIEGADNEPLYPTTPSPDVLEKRDAKLSTAGARWFEKASFNRVVVPSDEQINYPNMKDSSWLKFSAPVVMITRDRATQWKKIIARQDYIYGNIAVLRAQSHWFRFVAMYLFLCSTSGTLVKQLTTFHNY